jgi:hypothetical protein
LQSDGFAKAKVSAIYRTFYLWIADQNRMIAMQSNSQLLKETDKLSAAADPLYEVVGKPAAG